MSGKKPLKACTPEEIQERCPPVNAERSFAAPPLLAECVEYTKVLAETGRVQTVTDLLANVSYVYLTWTERAALAWRILKTIFR